MLSVFDQTRRDRDDGRMLRIDEAQYDGDAEMGLILHRLTMAAASAEMRHHMNVEDEYFSVIEKRDTEVLQARKTIAEQKDELAKQGKRLAKQDEKLAEQDEMLQKSVALLLKSGLSIHEIASALGVDIETVERLSKR